MLSVTISAVSGVIKSVAGVANTGDMVSSTIQSISEYLFHEYSTTTNAANSKIQSDLTAVNKARQSEFYIIDDNENKRRLILTISAPAQEPKQTLGNIINRCRSTRYVLSSIKKGLTLYLMSRLKIKETILIQYEDLVMKKVLPIA